MKLPYQVELYELRKWIDNINALAARNKIVSPAILGERYKLFTRPL